jgi:plastocyanin
MGAHLKPYADCVRASDEALAVMYAPGIANRENGIAARRVQLGLALTGLAVVLAACGAASAPSAGSGSPAGGSEAPSGSGATTTLSLKEFRITPETVTIKAGTSVTFAARNDGRMVHALVIKGNGINLATKDLAFGSGTTETITANLAAGTYTFFCPVGAHASLGMRGTLTVTP